MDGWIDGLIDRQNDRQIDRQIDGLTDGWIQQYMDGWMDRKHSTKTDITMTGVSNSVVKSMILPLNWATFTLFPRVVFESISANPSECDFAGGCNLASFGQVLNSSWAGFDSQTWQP